MTAAVQHDDVALRRLAERGEHAVDVDPPARGVVVGIGADLEAGGTEQRQVVRPGGVGEPDAGVGARLPDQVGEHAQRAAAADRLRRADARGVGVLAEHLPDHRLAEGGAAGRADVGLGVLRLQELLLGPLDRSHDGRRAVGVLVDADAEIELVGLARRRGRRPSGRGWRRLSVRGGLRTWEGTER